jgi:hypothetical protein
VITLINGQVQTPGNVNAVPLGSVSFTLTTDAQIIAPPFGQVLAGVSVVMFFDSTGNLVPIGNTLWSNLELNPQISGSLLGTAYIVNFYDANGSRINRSPQIWVFTQPAGSVVDIGTMTPIGLPVVYYALLGGGGGTTADTVKNFSSSQIISALTVGINLFGLCQGGASGINLTLPTAVGVPGQRIHLIKTDNTVGVVAVAGAITGTVSLGNQYQFGDWESDFSGNWWQMGNN